MENLSSSQPYRIPIEAIIDLSSDDRASMLMLEDEGVIDLYASDVDVTPALSELEQHGHETFKAESLHPTNPSDLRDKYEQTS